MSISESIHNMKIPDMNQLIQGSKSAKNRIDNADMNTVKVNFCYADHRFKTTIMGEIIHTTDIPICIIEFPEKLAYLVLDESLVYDVKDKCFEIYVNEKYTHALELSKQDMDMLGVKKIIVPQMPKEFKYQIIEMKPPKKSIDTKNILLTGSILYSLARSKLLERTQETTNDGAVIMGIMGAMVGGLVCTIITIALMGN